MTTSSQNELEQPAKVYQLNAVQVQLDQILTQLSTISQQTAGLVTIPQLEEVKKDLHIKIKNEVGLIHAEYRPFKKNVYWFIKAAIVEGLAIIGQAIILYIIARK